MRNLGSRVFAIVLGLSTAAPALVWADPETEVEGTVATSGLADLAVGNEVEVKWEPAVGEKLKIENETQDKEIKCRITTTDAAPSTGPIVCTVTESDVAGIAVGSTVAAEVNFSAQTCTTCGAGCGALPAKRACLRFTPSGNSVTVNISEDIDASIDDD